MQTVASCKPLLVLPGMGSWKSNAFSGFNQEQKHHACSIASYANRCIMQTVTRFAGDGLVEVKCILWVQAFDAKTNQMMLAVFSLGYLS
jgi:hypothetical protein